MPTLIDTNILRRSVQPSHPMHAAPAELARIEGFFEILTEDAASYATWKTLLIDCRVSGVQAHDARLAAVMKTHGIAQVVTFNVADFTRIRGNHCLNRKMSLLNAYGGRPGPSQYFPCLNPHFIRH